MNKARPETNDPAAAWERALDWLMRIQADPADAQSRLALDRWLAESDENARAYRKAEKVWRLTGALPAAAIRLPTTRRGSLTAVLVAAAACLALLLVPDVQRRLMSDHYTGIGERRHLTLSDGSSVDLDGDSAVTVNMAGDRRSVILSEGRAFFQVARDETRPFVVTTGETSVTVTGTAFDVHAARRMVTVEVLSGSVSVAATTADGRRKDTALQAGGRARISRADGGMTVDRVTPAQVGAWRTDRLVVDGVAVAQVVEDLRRHYGGLIVLRDDALAERRVTGVFDLRDPVQALRAAVQPHGGTVREPLPRLLVVSRP